MLFKSAFALASPSGKTARLSILIFHRVLAERDPLFPNEPDIARFDKIISWVNQWFNVLPLDEAVQHLKNGTLPARAAAITFDDGYADNLICATPILKKHGLSATFFIATGFLDGGRMWNDTVIESIRSASKTNIDCTNLGLGKILISTIEQKQAALERLIPAIKHLSVNQRTDSVARIADACAGKLPTDLMLTSEQVRGMRASGMGIGAHTVNHPILTKIDDQLARQEIVDSSDCLNAILNERISLFAYPNGKLGSDYNKGHAEIIKSLGFDAAFATNWSTCNSASNLYQLPRFTPWDNARWRFGLRLLMNTHQPDPALA